MNTDKHGIYISFMKVVRKNEILSIFKIYNLCNLC